MGNRNRLRQIKKQIIHRKIQPKRGTIIEQDFYRHIVIKHTNNKTRQRTKNNTKTKRNSKIHLRISSQHHTPIEEIKYQLPRLLTDNQDEIQK